MVATSPFLDPQIDSFSPDARRDFVHERIAAQLAYASEHVPFWRHRLGAQLVDPADYARIPPLTRAELKVTNPWDLVPESARSRIVRTYGTSGTTGAPVAFFWTAADWTAMADTFARSIERQRPEPHVVALNGYHQGHIAGQVYHSAVTRLGHISVPRHFLFDDEQATLDQLRMFRCNTLILAERSSLLKNGKTVFDLLKYQPDFWREYGITWWLGSTSTFTPEARALAREQGVRAITNLYGSAEFGALAVSCTVEPTHYHTVLGHALVEIVDDDGQPVASGQRGRVCVTMISSIDDHGNVGPRIGSQLLRLDNGDAATLITEPCACGLTAPRLHGIERRR